MKSLRVFGYPDVSIGGLALTGPSGPRRKQLVELLVDQALPREGQS